MLALGTGVRPNLLAALRDFALQMKLVEPLEGVWKDHLLQTPNATRTIGHKLDRLAPIQAASLGLLEDRLFKVSPRLTGTPDKARIQDLTPLEADLSHLRVERSNFHL